MDLDSGANGMVVGDMGLNYDNFTVYPDPSTIFPNPTTIDFNDPDFFSTGPSFFDNDIPVQPYVSPSSLVSISPTSIGYQQLAPPVNGSPMTFQPISSPPPSSGTSMGTSAAMHTPCGGTSLSPGLNNLVYEPPTKSKKKSPTPKNTTTPPSGPKKRGRKPKPIGTPDEEARRRLAFLERNRQAATKCRDKKKQKDSALQHRVQLLKSENARSKNALNVLCGELEDLVLMAKKHNEGNCCADELQATIQRAAEALEASQKAALVTFTPPASDDASPSPMMSPVSLLDSSVAGGFENADGTMEGGAESMVDFSGLNMLDDQRPESE